MNTEEHMTAAGGQTPEVEPTEGQKATIRELEARLQALGMHPPVVYYLPGVGTEEAQCLKQRLEAEISKPQPIVLHEPVKFVLPSLLRRFALVRRHDPTEVSGVGIVAEGVQYADNHMCALFWRNSASGGIYQDISVIREKHCHHGYTDLVWIDEEPQNVQTSVSTES